jgi:hypothetical protein
MNVKELAVELKTEPRVLRRFLRCRIEGVGSGSRYSFSREQVATLTAEFGEWAKNKVAVSKPTITSNNDDDNATRDELVWAEEEAIREKQGKGPLKLADIRDPRVRCQVKAKAAQAEARLEERLMAAGLHISQMAKRAS